MSCQFVKYWNIPLRLFTQNGQFIFHILQFNFYRLRPNTSSSTWFKHWISKLAYFHHNCIFCLPSGNTLYSVLEKITGDCLGRTAPVYIWHAWRHSLWSRCQCEVPPQIQRCNSNILPWGTKRLNSSVCSSFSWLWILVISLSKDPP